MRVDSINCKHWLIPISNIYTVEKSAKEVKCPMFKRLIHDLITKKLELLPKVQAERSNGNFHPLKHDYNIYHRLARRKNVSCIEKTSNIRKHEDSKVVLNEEQNKEMYAVKKAIQPEESEKLFKEGDQHNRVDKLYHHTAS